MSLQAITKLYQQCTKYQKSEVYIGWIKSLALIINIYCAQTIIIRRMFVCIYCKYCYIFSKTIYLSRFQCVPPWLVEKCLSSIPVSVMWSCYCTMSSVTTHTAACILTFNSSLSTIGEAKILSLMWPQKKKNQGEIFEECRGQGGDKNIWQKLKYHWGWAMKVSQVEIY